MRFPFGIPLSGCTTLFVFLILIFQASTGVAAVSCDPQGYASIIGTEVVATTCIPKGMNDNTAIDFEYRDYECINGVVTMTNVGNTVHITPNQVMNPDLGIYYRTFRNKKGSFVFQVVSAYRGLIDGKDMDNYPVGGVYTDVFKSPFNIPTIPDCERGDFNGCSFEKEVGSTVNVATGRLSHDQELFSTQAPTSLAASVSLHYRSAGAPASSISPGWSHSYDIYVESDASGDITFWENAVKTVYTLTNGVYTPESGDSSTLVKNQDGSVVITRRDGTQYTFSSSGKITTKTDRYGNALTFSPGAVLTGVTDSGGRIVSFAYYPDGRLQTITDPNLNAFTFFYTNGKLSSVSYPSNPVYPQTVQWTYTYNSDGLLEKKKDPNNFETTYNYTDKKLTSSVLPESAGTKTFAPPPPPPPANTGLIHPFIYPMEINLLKQSRLTLPNPEEYWTFEFDVLHQTLRSKTDPLDKTTTYTYYPTKYLKSRTVPFDGTVKYTTFYTYDAYGNVATVSEPVDTAAATPPINAETIANPANDSRIKTAVRYEYDYAHFDQIKKITDMRVTPERSTTIVYADDAEGYKVTTITDPADAALGGSRSVVYRYNQNGTLHDITDGNLKVTAFEYYPVTDENKAAGKAGQLSWVRTPDGVTYEFTTYDKNGNVREIKIKDAATPGVYRRTITQVPDALNRLREITHTTSAFAPITTTFGYDGNGNANSVVDPELKETQYLYNFNNKVTSIINVLQNGQYETALKYGSSACPSCSGGGTDKLREVYDARQMKKPEAERKKTEFQYDKAGRLEKEIDPEGKTVRYTYYDDGKVKEKWNYTANQLLITYRYNNRGDLVEKQYPNGNNIHFDFDHYPDGRLWRAWNNDITYTYTWYENGWLKSVSDSRGYSIAYDEYDGIGQRKKVTFFSGRPEQHIVNYDYDGANRPWHINSIAGAFEFTYDTLGRRDLVKYPNSTSADFDFDALDRLSSIDHKVNGGASFATFTYTPKPSGNRDSVSGTRNESYFYDSLYRILQTVSGTVAENFDYDEVGNRTTGPGPHDTAYVHDDANRMTAGRKLTYAYDDMGNQTDKIDAGAANKSWTQTWDNENRLVKIEKIKGSDRKTVTFKYDPFGRRIEKKVEEYHDGVSETSTYLYVYDKEDVALEVLTDESGTTTTRYVHGPGIDAPLALERSGSYYFYHADGLGSIVSITDASINIAQSYSYDTFGMVKPSKTFANSYAYTGREWDKETGLYFYRARYYDPMEGRFISKDPIGFKGGDMVLYGYVQNAPINFTDPQGLTVYACTTGFDMFEGEIHGPARHDYQCWGEPGNLTCRGFGRDPNSNKYAAIIYAPGKILKDKENDPYGKGTCQESTKDKCIEDCIARRWNELENKTPSYSWAGSLLGIGGEDCQNANYSISYGCYVECSNK